jgi:hypothetical protein
VLGLLDIATLLQDLHLGLILYAIFSNLGLLVDRTSRTHEPKDTSTEHPLTQRFISRRSIIPKIQCPEDSRTLMIQRPEDSMTGRFNAPKIQCPEDSLTWKFITPKIHLPKALQELRYKLATCKILFPFIQY